MKHARSAIIALALCVASFTALAAPSCTGAHCQYLPLITSTAVTLLLNGDFEQGAVIWQPSAPIITNPPAPVTPHSGTHVAQLVAAESGATAIAMDLIVPADRPFLSYWVWIRSTETNCTSDRASVGLTDQDVALVIVTFALCTGTQTKTWENGVADLSAHKGQSITLNIFTNTLDTNAPNSFVYLDDIGWRAAP